MNNHDSGNSDQILDFILCYPIVVVTSQSNVTYALALVTNLSGKIFVSVDITIYGVSLHWHYYTHATPIKL